MKAIAQAEGAAMNGRQNIRTCGSRAVICAKLHHQNNQPCIFNCGYKDAALKNQFTSGEKQ